MWYLTIGAVLIVCTLSFLLIYKLQIGRLIDRIKSVGKSGVSLEALQDSTSDNSPQKQIEQLTRELNSPLLNEYEDKIKEELVRNNLKGDDAVRILIKYLAARNIAFYFQEVYREIFGSQISLLDFLNAQHAGQPAEALKVFYVQAAAQYSDFYQTYSYDKWLSFLKHHLLIREDGGQLKVTERGREFLAYLSREGLLRNKKG